MWIGGYYEVTVDAKAYFITPEYLFCKWKPEKFSNNFLLRVLEKYSNYQRTVNRLALKATTIKSALVLTVNHALWVSYKMLTMEKWRSLYYPFPFPFKCI